MASNKNQHFVPRCYLRPFTIDAGNVAINIVNIDRQRLIEGAPVKHQCSGDYFYGTDPVLEGAIQATETGYAAALRQIFAPGFSLTQAHRLLLCRFWLFQHLRTKSASLRAVEMAQATEAVVGTEIPNFRLGIKEAVRMSMQVFAEEMRIVDDLRMVLIRNRTGTPFVTSDDPAILANRWFTESARTRGKSFGIHSAGALAMLPLSPYVLCLGYDGDVYSIPHEAGWVDVRSDKDIEALNQHQLLNCRANIFVRDAGHGEYVAHAFQRIKGRRPTARHTIQYAVLDHRDGGYARYRVIDRNEAKEHQEAMIHTQTNQAVPDSWPRQISYRQRGAVFTNDTGLGFVRALQAVQHPEQAFRKESIR